MTSLIINMPHLQSQRQRHGAMLLSLLCWAWFVMPLAIVAGWLAGIHQLAEQVVWLGGWKSLVRLSGEAVCIVAALLAAWGVWTLIDLRATAARRAPVAPAIDAAAALGANPAQVAAALRARVTTVHFTDDGMVARIDVTRAAGLVRPRRRTGSERRLAAG